MANPVPAEVLEILDDMPDEVASFKVTADEPWTPERLRRAAEILSDVARLYELAAIRWEAID